MTDKIDPTPAAPGQKRPHATLDLSAVEIKQSQGASTPGKQFVPGIETQPDRTLPPPQPRRSGGFFSHVLAGLAGGLIVLFGGDKILPAAETFAGKLGIKMPASLSSNSTPNLQQRLTAVEADAKAKRVEADARLAKLEDSASAVAKLVDSQAELSARTDEAVDKAAFDEAKARLKKLEDQLSSIAAAASETSTGGGNRVQGLAAITGKIAELESAFATKLADFKRGLVVEMEPKLAAISDASEKAVSNTERLDHEISTLRTDAARLTEQADVQKADNQRLAATVEVVKDKSVALTSSLNGLKGTVEKQLSEADVVSAVTPVSEKIAALETTITEVIKNETARKTSTERVVASLELGNLKRQLDRGEPYASELATVSSVLKGKVNLSSLDKFKDKGIPSASALQAGFSPLVNKIIDAGQVPAEGSVIERLMASAKSAVRVRKISHDPNDQSSEAIAGRIEAALQSGKLDGALALAKSLPAPSRAAAANWIAQLEARQAIDQAMTAIDQDLKATLTGAALHTDGTVPPAPKAPAAETPTDTKVPDNSN